MLNDLGKKLKSLVSFFAHEAGSALVTHQPRIFSVAVAEDILANEVGVGGLMAAFRSNGRKGAAFFAEDAVAVSLQQECTADNLHLVAQRQTQRRLMRDWEKTAAVITEAAQGLRTQDDIAPACDYVMKKLRLDPNRPLHSV